MGFFPLNPQKWSTFCRGVYSNQDTGQVLEEHEQKCCGEIDEENRRQRILALWGNGPPGFSLRSNSRTLDPLISWTWGCHRAPPTTSWLISSLPLSEFVGGPLRSLHSLDENLFRARDPDTPGIPPGSKSTARCEVMPICRHMACVRFADTFRRGRFGRVLTKASRARKAAAFRSPLKNKNNKIKNNCNIFSNPFGVCSVLFSFFFPLGLLRSCLLRLQTRCLVPAFSHCQEGIWATTTRSPSNDLSHPFSGEGSPTKIDY